jgi:hypothetical protein
MGAWRSACSAHERVRNIDPGVFRDFYSRTHGIFPYSFPFLGGRPGRQLRRKPLPWKGAAVGTT